MKRLWITCLALGIATLCRAADPTTSCVSCHTNTDLFDKEARAIVAALQGDVHAEVGLSCHDCHGGNPDPALAEDMDTAMDTGYAAHPYQGVPEERAIPGFCGRCHSDPSYMKRFRPDARVDQEQEYWTSQHGEALSQGDTRVATCVGCHGNHGIRRASDPESTVYPTRVAETCRTCHADGGRMAGYTLSDGSPLPINQYARWRQSIHAAAMFEKEDLSAPTCNDCHGNHGATPPGLDSLSYVCGQCHGREAGLFRGSAKHAGFEAHNEYLEAAGAEGCASCHEAPQAQLTGIRSFSECASCHGNHGIVRPTLAMFTALPSAPCDFCHVTSGLVEGDELETKGAQRRYQEAKEQLLSEASSLDLEGEVLFNWLVGKAQTLSDHTISGGAAEDGPPVLRPEFGRLFSKFRIGKTYYTYEDPSSGETIRAPIVRCGTCHASGVMVGEGTPGASTGVELLHRMQELTAETARAERILLSARRGGVETRDALLATDQAVDAQIGLEVLVHGFSDSEDSEFMQRYREGMEHAKAALEGGRQARRHLAFRRQGLAVSLLFIALVLIGLAGKIHELSSQARRDPQEATPT